ncbi:ORF1b [Zambian malbrouck virus 1]|uniref:Replicase polyprotein 1ab n=1 Tax=Zambian malbrouck virus 1 TaxID=2682610 RepID=A0A167L737_9NIDO|nr:ORF1b [Zambian malbrouck virus 1]ANB32502.1 ORF1b [Zambian malbrouck virus 1]
MLTTSGGTSDDRSGLAITLDYAKFVDHHQNTRAFGPIDIKIVTSAEATRTLRLDVHGSIVVAELADGHYALLRKHPPSLIDVITKGHDAARQPVLHGPGDTGIDGTLWDFESPASKRELFLTEQILSACAIRRGDAPNCLPYKLHPVRGDPYREGHVLKNTRFGDISAKIAADGEPWLLTTALNKNGTPVFSDGKLIGTTTPMGCEVYIPTIPEPVLDYLDSRPDMPTYYTCHGTENAALNDLSKFDLSTQGFILPQVFHMVRNYVIDVVGYSPAIYPPSTIPSNDSHAGVNGIIFNTKLYQSIPGIDQLVERMISEKWQSVTPVTLKKQYCSKPKTRTILGTNGLIALGLRSVLSGVTKNFQMAGKGPICLGKSKFDPLDREITGACLETDLASCDRSTPAIVRFFTTHLLFELARRPDCIPLYVLNCCHDLLVSQTTACTKRGGLSSGDPCTSIANTIYSLVLYTQHMVLSAFKAGHPLALKFLDGKLTVHDLIKVQDFIVYSDDLVLLNESSELPNFRYWVPHLELALGFKVDPKKTEITNDPGFLGCKLRNKYLISQRTRVLAALGYHMHAKTPKDYFESAVAILCDASAMAFFDTEWYNELVMGMAEAARQTGFAIPGIPYYRDFFTRVSGYQPEKLDLECGVCGVKAGTVASCGLALCPFCAHCHTHCAVPSPFCTHNVGEAACSMCELPIKSRDTNFDKLLEDCPYEPPTSVVVNVRNGIADCQPGRYVYHKHHYMIKKTREGCTLDFPDGTYNMKRLSGSCAGINIKKAEHNAARSTFIIGPPGAGKTTYITKVVGPEDVIYCPTHATLQGLSKVLPACRFVIPPTADPSNYGTPADHGPVLVLLAAGYHPGMNHFLDEACYANPLDFLKLITKTPLTCVGDPKQLPPVKFDSIVYLFDMMKRRQLTTIYRFSQNICDAIQCEYDDKLVSAAEYQTEIIVQKTFQPRGLVLTPYHKDRVGDAITIDSAQGVTRDVVTVYLPTPKSLTRPRALVAITRARRRLYVYDPHQQIEQYFKLTPTSGPTRPHAVVVDGQAKVIMGNQTHPAEQFPGMCVTARPRTALEKKILEESPLIVDFESGIISPLPQVGRNLGYYYSPDLPRFFPIPEKLCVHWPVITNKNNPEWPNRLVISLSPICNKSLGAESAGYYVGDSLFLGTPKVISYYITRYVENKPQELEPSLFSTGRIALDCRNYLDKAERDFALKHAHAFIGETKGQTVGGCHHITSCYLPPVIPDGDVVKIGVSAPGRAKKAVCTLTDVYLPLLEPYTSPPTASQCYKVNVDQRPVRLMVWKDATMYFQEGMSADALVQYANDFLRIAPGTPVYVAPELMPALVNRRTTVNLHDRAPVAITPWSVDAELLISTSDPFDVGDGFRPVAAAVYYKESILGQQGTHVFAYLRDPDYKPTGNYPPEVAQVFAACSKFRLKDTNSNLRLNSPSCCCSWQFSCYSAQVCPHNCSS